MSTPTVQARPSAVECFGIIEPMITTHVAIAAGLRRMSARPTLKPSFVSLRSRRASTESDGFGSSGSTAVSGTGAGGWLRAV